VDKGRLRDFFKIHSARRAGELLNLNSNQIQTMTGLLPGHCHLKGHPFKVGRVNSPSVIDAYVLLKQSHMFFVALAVVILQF